MRFSDLVNDPGVPDPLIIQPKHGRSLAEFRLGADANPPSARSNEQLDTQSRPDLVDRYLAYRIESAVLRKIANDVAVQDCPELLGFRVRQPGQCSAGSGITENRDALLECGSILDEDQDGMGCVRARSHCRHLHLSSITAMV
jgi:hypothetical protein